MRAVTKRELNQHTAASLDLVTPTEDLLITERGRPRWRVSAVRDTDSVLDRLEREGRYTPPAATPAEWPAQPGGPTYTDAEFEALREEMRGDH